MSQEYTKSISASRVEKFLWWCSGADRDLLIESCPPSDKVKYFGMGGVVLATGVLAAISSGFAFYTIFAPKGDAVKSTAEGLVNFGQGIDTFSIIASIVFGLLWGMMIFNLDRFIVSAGGKGDMKEGLGWKDLRDSWPRFIMAIILGIVISAPLEVRIMKTEIDAVLSQKQEIREFDLNKLSDSLVESKIKIVRTRNAPIEKQVKDNQIYVEKRRLEIKDQRKQLELEAEGQTASGIAGRGPAWRDKKENLDKMEAELDKLAIKYSNDEQILKQTIQRNESEIEGYEAERAGKRIKNKERAHQLDGLIERIGIAHEIGGWITILIMLMFILIEITPLLFKMMMTKTPYDYLNENKNAQILASNGILLYPEPHKDDSAKEVVTPIFIKADIESHRQLKEKDIIKQQIDNYTSGQEG